MMRPCVSRIARKRGTAVSWPRSEVGKIVDRLRELGVAAIAFDVVFSDPDRTSLSSAAEALKRAGATVTLPPDVLDNDQVLAHCRSDGPHVRGCFVVDHVLGKG